MKHNTGFSLVELLITIAIIGFVLAAGSDMFVGMLRGYKQQSKIAETNIEGIIGLELLRRDVESAGYGLPWTVNADYSEVAAGAATAYNDSAPTPSKPPRAVLSDLDANGSGRSYLVLKALNLARNDACTKWTNLPSPPALVTTWTATSENFNNNDRVIVISPGRTATSGRELIAMGNFSLMTAETSSDEARIIYGVDPDNDLSMPFNRADYYVDTTVQRPARCAQGTGVLVKAVVGQGDGLFSAINKLPLLDCVADMQVITYLDHNTPFDGKWDTKINGLPPSLLTDAATIRTELKEVHIYILTHEGQRDTSYTHPVSTIHVGESGYGRDFDLNTLLPDPNRLNYRWKVYTLVVRPNNLR